jgi:hypothetical protein
MAGMKDSGLTAFERRCRLAAYLAGLSLACGSIEDEVAASA